eukprot:7062105-Pyramimonas_sp.AAC.1
MPAVGRATEAAKSQPCTNSHAGPEVRNPAVDPRFVGSRRLAPVAPQTAPMGSHPARGLSCLIKRAELQVDAFVDDPVAAGCFQGMFASRTHASGFLSREVDLVLDAVSGAT